MSKRLKKQIQDLSGLSYLKREQKIDRAKEILSSTEEKQRICNSVIGLSFKDLEKFLKGIVESKAPLKDESPPELPEEREVKPIKTTLMLDMSEINKLICASEAPLSKPVNATPVEELYPYTYSQDEAEALIG